MTISNGSSITASDISSVLRNGASSRDSARQVKRLWPIDIIAIDATSSTNACNLQTIWTPQDNFELVAMQLNVEGATASDVHTFTLSVYGGGGAEYLLDKTVSVSVTSTGTGREDAGQNYDSTTGDKLMLRRGVPLLLALSTDSAGVDYLQGTLILRSRRRKV